MAVLTVSGRTAIARAVIDQDIHLAWGTGSADWDADKTVLRTFDGADFLDLGFGSITALSLASADGLTFYQPGTDYTADPAAGAATRIITGAISPEGTVSATFRTGRPPEPPDATALLAEVGRRLVFDKRFCLPDPAGDIVTTTGRYRSSDTPTRHIALRAAYDFADGGTAVIRETAVFIRTATDPVLPPGQRYFTPDQVIDPGTLLAIERRPPMPRDPAVQVTLDYVLSF